MASNGRYGSVAEAINAFAAASLDGYAEDWEVWYDEETPSGFIVNDPALDAMVTVEQIVEEDPFSYLLWWNDVSGMDWNDYSSIPSEQLRIDPMWTADQTANAFDTALLNLHSQLSALKDGDGRKPFTSHMWE